MKNLPGHIEGAFCVLLMVFTAWMLCSNGGNDAMFGVYSGGEDIPDPSATQTKQASSIQVDLKSANRQARSGGTDHGAEVVLTANMTTQPFGGGTGPLRFWGSPTGLPSVVVDKDCHRDSKTGLIVATVTINNNSSDSRWYWVTLKVLDEAGNKVGELAAGNAVWVCNGQSVTLTAWSPPIAAESLSCSVTGLWVWKQSGSAALFVGKVAHPTVLTGAQKWGSD
jgi:hypothetical protein